MQLFCICLTKVHESVDGQDAIAEGLLIAHADQECHHDLSGSAQTVM
jgi:hypothetical protein